MQTKSIDPLKLSEMESEWQRYFHQFCAEHGEPVPYGDRLLFRDGWQHSAMDYLGPNWPPPEGEVERQMLIVSYWKLRRMLVRERIDELTRIISGVQKCPAFTSVSLWRKIKSRAPKQQRSFTRLLEKCDKQLSRLS